MDRKEYLIEALDGYLNRKTVPDRLAGPSKVTARTGEIQALFRCLERYCPDQGVEDWVQRLFDRMDESATTVGWPPVKFLAQTAKDMDTSKAEAKARGGALWSEETAVQLAIDWFLKRQTAPIHGTLNRPAIADELIRRDILRDKREARFFGFEVDGITIDQIDALPMGPHEWRHHVAVMARLRGIGVDEADWQCRAEMGGPLTAPTGNPAKPFPGPSPRYRARGEPQGPVQTTRTDPDADALKAARREARARVGLDPALPSDPQPNQMESPHAEP